MNARRVKSCLHINAVPRAIFTNLWYRCVYFYECCRLETYCLSCYINQTRKAKNSWSSRGFWPVNTRQHVNTATHVHTTPRTNQQRSRRPAHGYRSCRFIQELTEQAWGGPAGEQLCAEGPGCPGG